MSVFSIITHDLYYNILLYCSHTNKYRHGVKSEGENKLKSCELIGIVFELVKKRVYNHMQLLAINSVTCQHVARRRDGKHTPAHVQ
jgi:hypothetical protein